MKHLWKAVKRIIRARNIRVHISLRLVWVHDRTNESLCFVFWGQGEGGRAGPLLGLEDILLLLWSSASLCLLHARYKRAVTSFISHFTPPLPAGHVTGQPVVRDTWQRTQPELNMAKKKGGKIYRFKIYICGAGLFAFGLSHVTPQILASLICTRFITGAACVQNKSVICPLHKLHSWAISKHSWAAILTNLCLIYCIFTVCATFVLYLNVSNVGYRYLVVAPVENIIQQTSSRKWCDHLLTGKPI